MVLSLRNREVHHTKNNGKLAVEKLSRQVSVVIVKEKHDNPISTKSISRNNETLNVRKSSRRQILADKTNNSDAESQVDVSKSKTVNCTPKSISKTISAAKDMNSVRSKKNKSPINHNNKELSLRKQICINTHQADSKNESLKLSKKYAVYEFEADENDPIEKKRKGLTRKRKIRTHKKLGCTVEEEIRAKHKKMQYLNKLTRHKANKRKAVKLTEPKGKDEIFDRHTKMEAKKTNAIVQKKNEEGNRENSREQSSHHLEERVADQQPLATPLGQEHQNSVSECFAGLPVRRRHMSPEIFNISKFGFTTSTAEKSTNINRCTVNNVSGDIGNLQQSKGVLQNTLQTPPVEKRICSIPIHGLNKKSKIPRELLSLFSPVQEIRYDDISEEIDILSPIRAPNATESPANVQQTSTFSLKAGSKPKDQSVYVETVAQIHTPDTNLQKTISSNHGTYKPNSCKIFEDFNISNCFGFDGEEEDILPRVVHTKLDSARSNQSKRVEELPRPFRANIVIPRRPLYPRINYKHTSKMEDQKQDTQNNVICDPNVSIFNLEEVECAADTSVADAGPSCTVRVDKDTPLESSLSQQSPKCYPVPKRLRPVRSKPIIEESENEEEEPTLKRHKRSHKAIAHDKELNKWATSFNSMCEEVDSFELCVE